MAQALSDIYDVEGMYGREHCKKQASEFLGDMADKAVNRPSDKVVILTLFVASHNIDEFHTLS